MRDIDVSGYSDGDLKWIVQHEAQMAAEDAGTASDISDDRHAWINSALSELESRGIREL
ncbi:hypothetical protein ABZ545_07130 [Streptomyces abikoensis]|uniref:hypothetical protein n=1 Tax=Streptomyces abikoensis TaxID=97398 RepID=UPI003400158B